MVKYLFHRSDFWKDRQEIYKYVDVYTDIDRNIS